MPSRRADARRGTVAAYAAACALALCVPLACSPRAGAQTVGVTGQVSGWAGGSFANILVSHGGLRYIPELDASYPLGEGLLADLAASVDAWGTVRHGTAPEGKIEPHRLWLRCTTERLELRAGLQKINFGSAVMMRPLMWFDRVDPRDPLKLTGGVYGALGRYVMQDNSNVWLWALYGNNGTKGIESEPTARGAPEFGGRVQLPAGEGEAALSFHHRRVESPASAVGPSSAHENRLGIDGRWDLGVGVWGEGVLVHRGAAYPGDPWMSLATIGADYTFAWGNGLALTCEHMAGHDGARLAALRPAVNMTALAATYPLTALDGASLMVFHDWRTGDWYRLASLSRTEDAWSAHLVLFWNPERDLVARGGGGAPAFAGTGVLLLAALYH